MLQRDQRAAEVLEPICLTPSTIGTSATPESRTALRNERSLGKAWVSSTRTVSVTSVMPRSPSHSRTYSVALRNATSVLGHVAIVPGKVDRKVMPA